MKRFLLRAMLLSATVFLAQFSLMAATHTVVVDFEEYASLIGPNNSWNGTTDQKYCSEWPEGLVTVTGTVFYDMYETGYFSSKGAKFSTLTAEPSTGMQYWDNFALSTVTETKYESFNNEMASVSGSGADGSLTYAVAMVGNSMFDEIPLPSITVSDATGFISVMIANTVYAATSMSLGDSFAAAIGYTDDGIWRYMELTITGYDAYGENVGAVSQDLGRNSKEYGVVVLEDWVEVDLSELVGATTLVFSLDSNEAGDFGPNYPFYFALDNLVYTTNDPVTTPEPATMAIFGLGILGVTAFRRRSRKDV